MQQQQQRQHPVRTKSVSESQRAVANRQPESIQIMGSMRIVRLDSPRFTVGSGKSNDLVLHDPYISKHHCTLLVSHDGMWIEDEDSRNGTWVNKMKVHRCKVWAGSRIVLGETGLLLLGPSQDSAPFGIVGEVPAIKKALAQIERFGPTLKPVLILGETGTGKELVARALHECSPCRLESFEPLNCSAIPRELAEAELFGHTEGAFTGATRERAGAFERADRGTLFLDEIGEMPLDLQPKLLRVLEEGVVQRIGDDTRKRVKVRLVAATHRELLKEARRGRFRLDLYHRLAVGVIELPALNQRIDDIPLLVRHFLNQEEGGGTTVSVDPEAMKLLKRLPWRGNVRELRNALHRALMEGGNVLHVDDFDLTYLEDSRMLGEDCVRYRGRTFKEIQHEVYLRVLRDHGYNQTAAASALAIPKSTFFDQIKAIKDDDS
jgi:DNA-binding NtrC family response regulator